MAATDVTRAGAPGNGSASTASWARRLATETKAAFKTTEFWSFAVIVAGILVSAAVITAGDNHGTDQFIARQAWLYVAIVTGSYLISRGLAKAGSQRYTEESGDNR
jgi:uncharacterized membrane protein YcjF (UPF0283 family)